MNQIIISKDVYYKLARFSRDGYWLDTSNEITDTHVLVPVDRDVKISLVRTAVVLGLDLPEFNEYRDFTQVIEHIVEEMQKQFANLQM